MFCCTQRFAATPGNKAILDIGDPDSDDLALSAWLLSDQDLNPGSSVDAFAHHQLSITVAPGLQNFVNSFAYMSTMLGSLRSPAKNKARRCLSPPRRPRLEKSLASGSSLRIARNAVGAVNSELTLYSSKILQKESASGVPTGLPSKSTVVAPASNGA